MVSQVLFGEQISVLEEQDKWLRVRCLWDNYEGWVAKEHEFTQYEEEEQIRLHQGALLTQKEGHILLSPGSLVHTESPALNTSIQKQDNVIETARLFLNCPYLWGGRSIWGIDCSGLVQVAFLIQGIELPRDASQQVNVGSDVPYGMQTSGDLAYFNNPRGKITHVGIMLDEHRIIHASGKVRIDRLDEEGIIRATDSKRTHVLHSIKRIKV